uniref:Transmembrane protein 198 n=1 Tax=Globisporangium ultimum (strain ATCC 200006 / CBS 805.95 / DAOM BR144) TaxID=431595 RepID=K3WBU6_GLOUD
MRAAILPLLWITAALAHVNAAVLTPDSDSSKNATAHANAEAMGDLQHFGDIAERVAPIAGLLFGPVLCFFGYAWYTHIVLVAGFVFGGVLFSIAAYLVVQSYSLWASIFMVAAFFAGGLLVAAIMKQRQAIGTFAIGGGLGIGLAYITFCFADLSVSSDDLKPLLGGSAAVLALLFGALFVKFEKVAIIGFTSVCGAYCWCYGVGHFIGHFPTWRALYDYAWPEAFDHDSGENYPIAWWWVYLVVFLALVMWNLCVQCKRSEKDDDSTKSHAQQEMLANSPIDADDRHAGYQRV